jgi:chromosome segregation ATPase
MASDLVERLRAANKAQLVLWPDALIEEAADRIEALEAEVAATERNRKALANQVHALSENGVVYRARIKALEAALRYVRQHLAEGPGTVMRPHHVWRACIVEIDRALEAADDRA